MMFSVQVEQHDIVAAGLTIALCHCFDLTPLLEVLLRGPLKVAAALPVEEGLLPLPYFFCFCLLPCGSSFYT